MQLHPNEPKKSVYYAAQSLSAKLVGLDFREDPGDLKLVDRNALDANEKVYLLFAEEMELGDYILVFAHNFPFALARVDGPYNYIKEKVPELGVWFRHFRRVTDVRYYGDFKTNAKAWESTTMTATITPLRKADSDSQRLIDEWLASTGE
jgi:hypothetical protein